MKNLLLILVLFFNLALQGQVDKKTLKAETLKYFDFVEANNSEGVINYMHPKVFETLPKEQMKAGMDQMLDNKDMKIEFLSSDINSITDIIEHENSSYVNIGYTNKMKMVFLSEKEKPVEDQNVFMGFMKKTMDSQFGEKNVSLDAENLALIVTVNSNLYAVYNDDFGGWKFVGNDDAMTAVINTIIPEKVRLAFSKK